MSYNYQEGQKRVREIMDCDNDIIDQDKVPKDSAFTFENGYKSWVTALFVDLRDSTTLFANDNKKKVSKIIRAFTSEIIDICNDDDNLREIGIRGDCVYAIYTTTTQEENYEIINKAFYINTFMGLLNEEMKLKSISSISAGIGISTAKELIVKAGRIKSGVNNKVWIGKAVTFASKLSAKGNKNNTKSIVIGEAFYNNIISQLRKNTQNQGVDSWFSEHHDVDLGKFYSCSIVITEFDQWVKKYYK